MPNITKRKKLLTYLEHIEMVDIIDKFLIDDPFDESGSDFEDEDEENDLELFFSPLLMRALCEETRFIYEKTLIPKSNYRDLILPNVSEALWQRDIRMTHETFINIFYRIRDDPIFHNNSNNVQAHVSIQMMITFYRFGHFGNAASVPDVASKFGVATGSVDLYTNRVIIALFNLLPSIIVWPNREERRAIATEIKIDTGFPDCIGFVDGTHAILEYEPLQYGDYYMNRKKSYSIAMMIVCDYQKRIRFLHTGFCGSAHDSRVFKNSPLWLNSEKFFEEQEYILADSGYSCTERVIPNYKKPEANAPDNRKFNAAIASVRVTVEDCIGMLKGNYLFY